MMQAPNVNKNVLNILVTDDESVSRQMVRRLLKEAGIDANIEELQTAAETIQVLSDRKFDVAILDYRLPDGSALSILRSLRKYGRLHTPIIVMTAHAPLENASEALDEGAQDYLPKEEITADNLERSIRYSIQRHKLSHELQWSKERERREKELRSLAATVTESDTSPSSVKTLTATFERFVERYSELLKRSLEETSYATTHDTPELARTLAQDLGELRAGPKDVIDIHSAALKKCTEFMPKQKQEGLTAESRIVLVQVLGGLVTYYRK